LSTPTHVILDTDAFSYLLNRRPQAAGYGPLLTGKIPALTFVTVAELHFGALSDNWQDRRHRELEQRIDQCVILPFDGELPLLWARLRVQERRAGRPLGQREHVNDLWIAACGIYYDAPVLTGNVRHFSGVPGLRVMTVLGTPVNLASHDICHETAPASERGSGADHPLLLISVGDQRQTAAKARSFGLRPDGVRSLSDCPSVRVGRPSQPSARVRVRKVMR